MTNRLSRTEAIIGNDAIKRLTNCRVAVFGVGGVGGYVCEALARGGVGNIDLIDGDTVSISNLNRQIIALKSTLNKSKVEVMKERILDIDENISVKIFNCFFKPENSGNFAFEEYDYVIDAVDMVTAKIEIIMKAREAGVPVISAMGAGNKLDPGRFKVADIYETTVCPLAKVMRKELRNRGVEKLKVVYSEESPIKTKSGVTGSTSYAPGIAGLMIAGEVIRDLIGKD